MARMKNNNPRNNEKNPVEAAEYSDYYIKFLNNKKMTYYKKLERIEVLKLKDMKTLQKEQVQMIEKTPLWHEKISEWNRIQALYMESIRRYKPELLDPSLGESEEDKLRVQVKQLENELKEAREQTQTVQTSLDTLKGEMEQMRVQARSQAVTDTVGRVVRFHNYVECCAKFPDLCGEMETLGSGAKDSYSQIFANLEDLETVTEEQERRQEEELAKVMGQEDLWSAMGKCCAEGVLMGCQRKMRQKKEEEEAERVAEEKRKEEEEKERLRKEEEQKEKEKSPEKFNNYVEESDESEEEVKETKKKEEEKPAPPKTEEDDLMDQFFKKKESTWKEVPNNRPPPRNFRRGSKKYHKHRDEEGEEKTGKKYRGNNRRYNKKYNKDGDFNEGEEGEENGNKQYKSCLLYTSPSPRDLSTSRMPSSA